MNYGMVFYILGWILRIESVLLLLPGVVGFIYREKAAWLFLLVAGLAFLLSFLLNLK